MKYYYLALYLCLLFPSFTKAESAQLKEKTVTSKTFGYKNPVITGFNPDPSVCRVGDDYYLVTSSFEYFPGVPVYHSKDLINWEQIGHCLTRESQLPLKGVWPSGGIFAPTIRYHEGRFYMVTTLVSDKGNFYVYADDPAGEWSDPIWVNQGGIDPSLLFEDGKCYFMSTDNGIRLSEIDIKTGKKLTESKVIWNGTGGRYPEAPHIYKKDGWYYLMIAEGGTEYGHKETIARSRNIYGPYQSNPSNPILTHMNEHTQSNPIQGTGHADLIQAHDSSWWVVFLGFRPQSGTHHLLGRETFLAPVRWDENAWPVINATGSVSIDMNCATLPQTPVVQVNKRTDFKENKLGFEWNYLRNPNFSNYTLAERKGYLRLKPSPSTLSDLASPTFVGRRQQHIEFEATTSLDFKSTADNEEAGLTIYMCNNSHYDIYVTNQKGVRMLNVRYHLGNMQHIDKSIEIPKGATYLRVAGGKEDYAFYYSTDDKNYTLLSKMNTRFLSSEPAGGFTGIYIALFATTDKSESTSRADFDWFDYEGKNW